jgi:hypothetical protein
VINRVNQDTNAAALTYSEYASTGTGNGRRLVAVPINTGAPNNVVLGIALFFLLTPDDYPQGGNSPWCAEYVGPYVQDSQQQGAGDPGAYVVRLVR